MTDRSDVLYYASGLDDDATHTLSFDLIAEDPGAFFQLSSIVALQRPTSASSASPSNSDTPKYVQTITCIQRSL